MLPRLLPPRAAAALLRGAELGPGGGGAAGGEVRGVHRVRGPALQNIRRQDLQLPGQLQVPADPRLQQGRGRGQQQLLHPHHERRAGHGGVLVAAHGDGAAGQHQGVAAAEDAGQGGRGEGGAALHQAGGAQRHAGRLPGDPPHQRR